MVLLACLHLGGFAGRLFGLAVLCLLGGCMCAGFDFDLLR